MFCRSLHDQTSLPFALSLSKGWCRARQGFDKLSPNGMAGPHRPRAKN